MMATDWIALIVGDIRREFPLTEERLREIFQRRCPFNPDGPLLQCMDCRNTESPAGAMAREFNKGKCLHCGGVFKVVRA
jgi:hypothetical protein